MKSFYIKNYKKTSSLLLSVLVFLSAFSVSICAFAHGEPYDFGACGSAVQWEYYDDGTLEFIGSGEMYNFNVADSIESMYYPYADGISTVNIENGIENIGADAFYGFVNLTQINIPESVLTIGEGAFSGCSSLKSVTLSENVLEIGDNAFLNCCSLEVIYYGGSEQQWEIIAKGNNDFSGVNIVFIDSACPHINTDKYDAVAPKCNEFGSTASEFCLDCEEWIVLAEEIPMLEHNYSSWQMLTESTCTVSGAQGRECSECLGVDVRTLPISHTDKNSDNICDLCKDKITTYTTDDYYNIFRKLAYNSSRFIPGENAPDSLVHWYLQNSGDFKSYFDDATWRFTVPYDVYISSADKYFYKHSDMKVYLTEEEMWEDESQENICWFAGGMGGPDDVVVLSVHFEGDKIVAQCAEVFLAYEDEYFDNLREGYDYIYYTRSYVDENGDLIEETSKVSVEGALELTLIDTDDGLKIAGYENLDYYIVNGHLYNIVDDFKVKYNSFTIDCNENVLLKSGERLLSDCFSTFQNNGNYWYEQGAGLGFTVEVPENVKVSVDFTDENGARNIEPTSFGTYSIIPSGNAVLKVKTECVNECEYERTIIEHSTCKAEGKALYTCKFCGESYTEIIDKNEEHSFKNATIKATLTKNGKIENKCTVCDKVKSVTTINYPKTIKLSSGEVTYNGSVRNPTVTVKDSKGNTLKKDRDYTIKTPSGRKLPGVYEYKIKFKGNYEGETTLQFTILPKAPTTISATQSTSAINLTWSASAGATGYRVYQYSSSKGKYVQIASVKGTTSYKKSTNLKDGTEYKFKIKPYTKLSDGTVLFGVASDAFTTATECKAPKITSVTSTSKAKANVKWSNVDGETGYQLYYSTKKTTGFKKVDSYSANKLTGSKTFSSSASGKTIYFKVRAYKKVAGQTIYGEWSTVKSVKLK